VFKDDLEVRVVSQRREEEQAVDEWVLVIDVEHRLTDDARHRRHLLSTQTCQQEAACLIIAVRPVVLRLYVVRVLHRHTNTISQSVLLVDGFRPPAVPQGSHSLLRIKFPDFP